MNIANFFTEYADEQSCKMFFKQKRESETLCCKQCGSLEMYWIEKETRWRCGSVNVQWG
jgi:hypothetical protein